GTPSADLVEGLLSDLWRKNGWSLAERAGHATPHRIQKLLGEASWSAEMLLAGVQAYVLENLGDPSATLVLDDTQVIKKGTKSVGVAHQHCGVTGDVRNCQVMVMLTYAAPAGHTFYDRRLYLPEAWTSDTERRREAGIPEDVAFATKPQLGRAMLADALAPKAPFRWLAADADYGKDPGLRADCHRQRIPYVLAVPVSLPVDGIPGRHRQPAVASPGDLLHYALGQGQWERRSCGEGSKGERLYDWTCFKVTVKDQQPADGFAHWLLIHRSTEKKQLAGGRIDYEYGYFLAHAPRATAATELISQAGIRWKIEEDNEQGKQLTGLGRYQVRKWTPWYRHVTCAMLALAFLAVQRAQHPDPDPHTDGPRSGTATDDTADDAGKAQLTNEKSGSP
ncbi:IS701 family transposase, partial [Streptomyces olivoreticuli]